MLLTRDDVYTTSVVISLYDELQLDKTHLQPDFPRIYAIQVLFYKFESHWFTSNLQEAIQNGRVWVLRANIHSSMHVQRHSTWK